jgi:hypothetical protein
VTRTGEKNTSQDPLIIRDLSSQINTRHVKLRSSRRSPTSIHVVFRWRAPSPLALAATPPNRGEHHNRPVDDLAAVYPLGVVLVGFKDHSSAGFLSRRRVPKVFSLCCSPLGQRLSSGLSANQIHKFGSFNDHLRREPLLRCRS